MQADLRALLSQGLDLCVRARRLAEMDEKIAASPDWRSGTIPLWAEEQYQKDLAAWEERARSALEESPDAP